MHGSIVGADIVPQEGIELCQGRDGIHVQRIKPGLLERPELAFNFCLAGAVTNFCMKEDRADGAEDQGELFI